MFEFLLKKGVEGEKSTHKARKTRYCRLTRVTFTQIFLLAIEEVKILDTNKIMDVIKSSKFVGKASTKLPEEEAKKYREYISQWLPSSRFRLKGDIQELINWMKQQ